MLKKYVFLVLILAILMCTPFTLTTKSTETKTTTDNLLSAKITELRVVFYSNASFFYTARIEINNPTNTPITLSLPNQCGFGITIDARNGYNYGGYGHIFCPVNKAPYSITYNPGITNETFNATAGFNLNNTNLKGLPVGFYYFDLTLYQNSNFNVSDALMVYLGNDTAEFEFYISPSYYSQISNSNLPIAKQVSLFNSSFVLGTQNSPSGINLANSLPLVILGLLVIVSLVGGLFIQRRNKKLRNLNNLFSPQEGVHVSDIQHSLCKKCGFPLNNKDNFCSNCGLKIP